jgi:hypothetical protein
VVEQLDWSGSRLSPVGVVGGFRPIDEREWLSFSEATSPQVRKISLRGLGLLD